MSTELDAVTQLHVDRAIEALREEFGEQVSGEEIERLVRDSLERLVPAAEVNDFVPTLAYRFARERLVSATRSLGTGVLEVLFVGLGDTGRGQMAAALTSLRSDGRVIGHSAGSAVAANIDSAVVEAMGELGVDLGEAYAKPLTEEALRGADVIVTMGRSVGAVELPADARREDWRVGDPTGAPLEEVRRVREDIDRRVTALVTELLETEPHQTAGSET